VHLLSAHVREPEPVGRAWVNARRQYARCANTDDLRRCDGEFRKFCARSFFRSDANEDCVCELSHDRLVAIGAQLLQIALRRVGVMEWELAVEVVALLDLTKSFDRFVYVGHDFIVQSHV
jgi:hypothetical protein